MEPHNALELLVLPIVRGVGGALACLVALELVRVGFGLLLRQLGLRGRTFVVASGPHRPDRPRRGPAILRAAELSR